MTNHTQILELLGRKRKAIGVEERGRIAAMIVYVETAVDFFTEDEQKILLEIMRATAEVIKKDRKPIP